MLLFYFYKAKLQKKTGKLSWERVGVAELKPTRDDNSKGPRIGPSLFHTSKLYKKYIKLSKLENHKDHNK